jgi:hypothetical protein
MCEYEHDITQGIGHTLKGESRYLDCGPGKRRRSRCKLCGNTRSSGYRDRPLFPQPRRCPVTGPTGAIGAVRVVPPSAMKVRSGSFAPGPRALSNMAVRRCASSCFTDRIGVAALPHKALGGQTRIQELLMTIDRRAVLAALPLSFLLAGSLRAAPKHHWRHSSHSWDGTWSGNWGGSASQATSITIVRNKVVSYTYQGASTAVSASDVTATTVTYGENGVRVVLTRTGHRTATGSLHSPQGDATAALIRQ